MSRENSLWSAMSAAVGRCFGSELMAKPNRMSWMIGMPTIMPKVSRSRLSWMNSLPTMPSQREIENQSLIDGPPRSFALSCALRFTGAAHEMDEDVLQSRLDLAPFPAVLCHQRLERILQTIVIRAGHVQHATERGDLFDFRQLFQPHRERGKILASDRPGEKRLAGDHLVRGTLCQELAVEDVSELVAALGLVHVMRAHENGDAARGQRMQLVPEIAPRLGIHARRRLVEKQELRIVQQTRSEREPLLPASRQGSGELVRTILETELFELALDALVAVLHAVHAGDEAKILADGEVDPERESLGHVADVPLDLFRLAQHVVAEASALPAVGREQPADHPDRGRLATAVGSQKTEDLAAPHGEREILHGVVLAEVLVDAAHVDDDVVGMGIAHFCAGGIVTSTGCPGLSFAATSAAGLASTRNK